MAVYYKTEAEARNSWCPFVRAGVYSEKGPEVVTVNRDPRHSLADLAPCVGSDCMAWRYRKEDGVVIDFTRGYCGLAGK